MKKYSDPGSGIKHPGSATLLGTLQTAGKVLLCFAVEKRKIISSL
jgi:hypothetical protein